MKKKKTTTVMNAMGNAARGGRTDRVMEDILSPDNLRQAARDTAPIGVLEDYLRTLAFNEEEEEAIHAYCWILAFFHGGLRTEEGRRMIALGFADGRRVVLENVQMMRKARAMRDNG